MEALQGNKMKEVALCVSSLAWGEFTAGKGRRKKWMEKEGDYDRFFKSSRDFTNKCLDLIQKRQNVKRQKKEQKVGIFDPNIKL